MMLTAGLGVSEMMIGWDNVALELGGVTPLLLSNDAVDKPLDRKTKANIDYFFSVMGKNWKKINHKSD